MLDINPNLHSTFVFIPMANAMSFSRKHSAPSVFLWACVFLRRFHPDGAVELCFVWDCISKNSFSLFFLCLHEDFRENKISHSPFFTSWMHNSPSDYFCLKICGNLRENLPNLRENIVFCIENLLVD